MNKTIYFPLFFKLEKKVVLIIGGGRVATRKAKLFKKSNAIIRVVAPEIHPELMQLADECIFEQASAKHFTKEIFLVVIATDNSQININLANLAKEKGILCNIVDNPSQSDFWTGATVIKYPIIFSIITSGLPSFSKIIANKIAITLSKNLIKLLAYLVKNRKKINDLIPSSIERLMFWREIARIIIKKIDFTKNKRKKSYKTLLKLVYGYIKNFSK